MADNFRGGKRKKRKLPKGISKATTIAPGKRYYGPKELRPSTKYKRAEAGGVAKFQERGGEIRDIHGKKTSKEIKGRGYIDIEQAKFQMQKAGGMPPAPGWKSPYPQKDVKGVQMSKGFAEKYAEAEKGIIDPKAPEEGYNLGGRLKAAVKGLLPGAKPLPGSPGERLEQEAAAAGLTPYEAQLEKIAATTGIPAGWVETLGTMATAPLVGTLQAGTKYTVGKGLTRVSFFGGPKVVTHVLNTKAVGLLGQIWASTSGKIALITGGASVILGGAHLASIAIGSIMLGMWGGTESPEGAQIPLGQRLYEVVQRMPEGPDRDAAWKKFDNYMALSKSLSDEADPRKFKNQIQPWKQLYRKWQQTRMGMDVLTDAAEIERGMKSWEDIKQEEKEEDMMMEAGKKAYYARLAKEERKATLADQKFWANLQKEKQEAWELYWEERDKAEQNNMKSNLKFGLL